MRHRAQSTLKRRVNRRRFLKLTGATAVAAVVSEPLFAIEALAAPLTRHNISGLTASSKIIKSYEKAIGVMQALSISNPSDPTGWIYQAEIHGCPQPPAHTAWGTCQHNQFFWAWHRMYLYWFERIIRKKSGDADWTLPFWAWDTPSERHIPPLFRDPTSKLFSSDRVDKMNDGTGHLGATDTDVSGALSDTYFTSTMGGGANDDIQGPHGYVHVKVGKGFADFSKTAKDPLFWLHHCNVDRLWQVWRSKHGGSDPTGDASWTGQTFTFFDENGKQLTMTGCDVLNTATQLKYQYEGVSNPLAEPCPNTVHVVPPTFAPFPFTFPPIPPLAAQPVHIPLPIPPELQRQLLNIVADPTKTVYLQLADLTADVQPGVTWATFVGPQSAPRPAVLSGKVPADPQSPFYVGSVYLFGHGIKNELPNMPTLLSFPLNRALAASSDRPLYLTFVAQGIVVGNAMVTQVNANVKIGKASIVVRTLKRG
ncbi:MAG: tyrosinase family protein [Candidatus Eremiobacteraeota bacterium]|nr:tyrosinase family protein [Candidatus Eremiobacteraeota bacterium]